ncbi:MAG: tripartite tricarboxylate transporter substrate-binding protein [Polaromonas sp.]|nr:tripartite tricarboxylate transporter substrate-binding protein [Polaromonas sp.]
MQFPPSLFPVVCRAAGSGGWPARAVLAAASLALAQLMALPAVAQTYPDKPVRMVVPFGSGGGTDALARLLAQKLGEGWGQSIVVENKAGAQGNIGARFVSAAKPDGYTLLASSSSVSLNPSIIASPGYEQKDLEPVIFLGSSPYMLMVNPKVVAANTLPEFIAWTKTKGAAVTWASNPEGNADHLAGTLLQQRGGFTMQHIPYKGGAEALNDVVAGHVAAGIFSLPTAMAYMQSGQLKAIALLDSKRAPQLPQVPTVLESGITGAELPTWYAIWVPAGTPADVTAKIHAGFDRALKLDDVKKRMLTLGFAPGGGSQAEFADYARKETEKFARVVQSLGLKKQ